MTTGKRGRPGLPLWMEELIEAKSRESKMPPLALAVELKKLIEDMGEISPAEDTLKKRISNYRNSHNSLDEPWSFGLLANPKYEIAQSAVDSLMKVWQYSLAIGHLLTIREALWVARLSKGFLNRHITLFKYSITYAIRERVCEVLDKPMDTRDLDADWVLTYEEQCLQRFLDMLPNIGRWISDVKPRLGSETDIKLLRAGVDTREVPLFFLTRAANQVLFTTNAKLFNTIKEVKTPNAYMNDLTEEEDRICATVLLLLSKGPKWNTLSKEEFLLLLSEVRQIALDCSEGRCIEPYGNLDETIDPNLLSMVGIEQKRTKEREVFTKEEWIKKKEKIDEDMRKGKQAVDQILKMREEVKHERTHKEKKK